jgi:di/tricarboxylate transporter
MVYATPIGMLVNTMFLSPGGYKFRDYTKAGLPLMVFALIVSFTQTDKFTIKI